MMRRMFIFMLVIFSFMGISAQTVNLDKMSENNRKEYLVNLSKEVIKNFGPDYCREFTPLIEEMKNEIFPGKDIQGREYYRVTFPLDKAKETLHHGFSARVKIWKDTGEPFAVMFGNGVGKSFFHISYKKWLEAGILEADRVKYQQEVIMK